MQKTFDNEPLPAWHADAYSLIDRRDWRALFAYACRDLETSLELLRRADPAASIDLENVADVEFRAVWPLFVRGGDAERIGEFLLCVAQAGCLTTGELQAVADAVALMFDGRARGEQQRPALDLFLASDGVASIVRRAIQH